MKQITKYCRAAFVALVMATGAQAAEIKVAVTTSFYNSGLSDILLPVIKDDLDLDVQLIVVGTGQALRLGRAGDVDAILVHSRKAEIAFLGGGFGTHRREIMYNDFVFIGPSPDPADLSKAANARDAMQRIKTTASSFVSRGDDSGTHKKELSLWGAAGVTSDDLSTDWYHAAGAGMGATLNVASGMDAYVLADRASWLNFGNKGGLTLLYAGDPTLFNQYAYIPVNPALHPHVKTDLANSLEAWLVSPKAENLISNYRINGELLFTFNAVRN